MERPTIVTWVQCREVLVVLELNCKGSEIKAYISHGVERSLAKFIPMQSVPVETPVKVC
jgi:hypothetical protein